MALVSWAKKELSRFKLQKPKRLTLAEISTSTKCLALPLIQEVVLDADLRCPNCQNRVSSVISNVEDVESMEVHILEKKVTLIHRSTVVLVFVFFGGGVGGVGVGISGISAVLGSIGGGIGCGGGGSSVAMGGRSVGRY
ncbi:hypothetical protein T459_05274 [Capsicum annuum]|uniref:HMA domain-containing protein n=1 Tax=Capsicum annuum TaxID=4072 RepID=A0A2G3A7H5_CAPAN|nr:hypothetical protein T459_05274 [Capsicum annuum]